jgi:hypothetical protein
LNDLAGASLSAEHEKRRLNLEKKISTVRKISPPPTSKPSALNTLEIPEQKQPRRPRAWSFPPTVYHEPLQEALEKKGDSSQNKDTTSECEGAESSLNNASFSKDEKDTQEVTQETTNSLRNRRRFERLRQAYNNTVKVPRQRSASVPHVSTLKHDQRKPNPEYIQVISSLAGFVSERKKDCERKPNKKGFNVVWRCGEDEG